MIILDWMRDIWDGIHMMPAWLVIPFVAALVILGTLDRFPKE